MSEELDDKPLTLKEAFNFTWEDLAENRQGRLSEAQKQRLRQFPKRFLYAFVFVLGLGVLLYVFASAFPSRRGLSPELVIFLFGTMLAVLTPVILIQWWRLNSDLRDGKVITVRGTVTIKHMGGRYDLYYVEIDGVRQNLDLWVEAFEEGENYIVYYTPRLKRPVAAEKID